MKSDSPDKPELKITDDSTPVNVPTFACIVYVSKSEGGVRARVGNLPGIEAEGASERDALAKIVPAFKARIVELLSNDSPIPWIDPPAAINADEQKRFIPVHL